MTVQVPDSEVIRNAVTLACHAPSLHNSQPWRWVAATDWNNLNVGSSD
jgi:nitroreductase